MAMVAHADAVSNEVVLRPARAFKTVIGEVIRSSRPGGDSPPPVRRAERSA
jgi:hypothetical protein